MDKSVERHLLQTMVPVRALTLDHLNTLLRDHHLETVCGGTQIFNRGEYDNRHIYLISGSIQLTDRNGQSEVLSAGDEASRYAIAHYQPRAHSATALTDSTIIRFNSDRLDGMLAWDQAAHYIMLDIAGQRDLDEDADWMMTLLKSNLFYKVPPMNIRKILDKFEPVYLEAGDTVIRQGEVGDCCYIIKEGVVGVYQSEDDRSPSVQVNELGAGLCFGEDALVNDTARNATIVMHSNGVLMRLSKQDFYLLLKQPEVQSVDFKQACAEFPSAATWLDVRTQDEYERGHFDGALNMPLNLLKLKSRMLDSEKAYLVYCNTGRRSEAAAHLLGVDGYNAVVLKGGISLCEAEQQSFFGQIIRVVDDPAI